MVDLGTGFLVQAAGTITGDAGRRRRLGTAGCFDGPVTALAAAVCVHNILCLWVSIRLAQRSCGFVEAEAENIAMHCLYWLNMA
jgi:hypothetical protein